MFDIFGCSTNYNYKSSPKKARIGPGLNLISRIPQRQNIWNIWRQLLRRLHFIIYYHFWSYEEFSISSVLFRRPFQLTRKLKPMKKLVWRQKKKLKSNSEKKKKKTKNNVKNARRKNRLVFRKSSVWIIQNYLHAKEAERKKREMERRAEQLKEIERLHQEQRYVFIVRVHAVKNLLFRGFISHRLWS